MALGFGPAMTTTYSQLAGSLHNAKSGRFDGNSDTREGFLAGEIDLDFQ